MFFLIMSNADIDFLNQELRYRIYTTKKALSTTRRVKLVEIKAFVAVIVDLEYKTFVADVASLRFIVFLSSIPLNANIYPFRRHQIAGLIVKERPIKVPNKYVNFVNIFSFDLAFEFFKHTGINNHIIELVDGQQPPYGLIYSLRLIELVTVKTYIETNLANEFIRLYKSLAGTFIFIDRKLNRSFRLYVNYRELNKLIIKK